MLFVQYYVWIMTLPCSFIIVVFIVPLNQSVVMECYSLIFGVKCYSFLVVRHYYWCYSFLCNAVVPWWKHYSLVVSFMLSKHCSSWPHYSYFCHWALLCFLFVLCNTVFRSLVIIIESQSYHLFFNWRMKTLVNNEMEIDKILYILFCVICDENNFLTFLLQKIVC